LVNFTKGDFNQEKYNEKIRRWHYINLFNSNLSKIRIDYQHFRLCFYNPQDIDDILQRNINKDGDTLTFGSEKILTNDPFLFEKLIKQKEIKEYLESVLPNAHLTDTVVRYFLLHQIENNAFPRRLTNDEIISMYEKVLKDFELEGQKASYETLDIEYKDYKYGKWSLSHIWNCYGYRKNWIFLWTSFFLLMFTAVTFLLINKLNDTKKEANAKNGVYVIKSIPDNLSSKTFYDVIRRAWYSFIYTSIIFFFVGLKVDNINFRKILVIYIIIIYSTGLLCLGYIANFVLQK
jgi:hypothetical protein